MVTRPRADKIRKIVRKHLASVMKDAIAGSEEIFKEVWEELKDEEEEEAARSAMKEILDFLR